MLRIGAVARAAGMTVRTLRHYDEIGLLVPSGRTDGGYRLYSGDDVRRLYRIVALRRLGFGLGDVAAMLARDGDDPRPVIREQIDRLGAQIEAAGRLRDDLRLLLASLEGDGSAPAEQFLHAIEGMRMIDRYYTPEQLEQLERRRQEVGDEAIARSQQEWADLIAQAQALRERGTDPATRASRPSSRAGTSSSRRSRAATRGSAPRCSACTRRRARPPPHAERWTRS